MNRRTGWRQRRVSAQGSALGGDPSTISADYEDETGTGSVEYRVRMVAPASEEPSEWRPMPFTPRPAIPDPDHEEAANEYLADRYQAEVSLQNGKYHVDFRATTRSGKREECSCVTLIVDDGEHA